MKFADPPGLAQPGVFFHYVASMYVLCPARRDCCRTGPGQARRIFCYIVGMYVHGPARREFCRTAGPGPSQCIFSYICGIYVPGPARREDCRIARPGPACVFFLVLLVCMYTPRCGLKFAATQGPARTGVFFAYIAGMYVPRREGFRTAGLFLYCWYVYTRPGAA